MIKIILLGLSASIDSWAVGAAYRAGDIRIPWYTKAIVALVSAVTSMTAVFLGNGMGHFIDTAYIQMAGGFVLFVIGARSVWGAYHHREEKNYDADSSKTIDPWEGVLLEESLPRIHSAAVSVCVPWGQKRIYFPLL